MNNFKLSKADLGKRDAHQNALSEAADVVTTAIQTYNEVLDDAREFCADIAQIAQDEWDDKSEKWQESDRAQDCSGWIDEWRDVDLEGLEDLDFHADKLGELPEAAS